MKSSILFYLLMVFFIITGISYSLSKLVPLGFSGSQGFIYTIGDTSFMFILSMFAAHFIGSEFSNRTIHNEVKLGYSRTSTIIIRGIVVLPALSLLHLIYVFSVSISLGTINGLGSEIPVRIILVQSILAILQVMAIQCFTLLIVFYFKKSSLGMISSVCFTFVTCNILRNLLGPDDFYFGITSFYRIMMEFQSLTTKGVILSFLSAIMTLIIVFCVTCATFQKSELK